MEVTVAALRAKYRVLSATLDERALRLCAAGDAKMFGYGGISFVAKAAGLSRTTLHAGLAKKVADTGSPLAEGRIRQAGGVGNSVRRKTRHCWRTWIGCSIRRRAVIRCHRCAGRARARRNWRRSCKRRGMPFRSPRCGGCWMSWTTACSPIARPAREQAMPIGTLNSSSSTDRQRIFSAEACRSFPWTPKERIGGTL